MIIYRKILQLACIAAVCIAPLASEEVNFELPPKVQKKIDEHKADVAQIIEDAQEEIIKSQEKILKLLDKELKAETRKGNFGNAMAITKYMESLKESDKKTASLFGDNLNIAVKASRFKILKVALADNSNEKQHNVPYDFIKHVQVKLGREEYVINFKKEFEAHLPKGFSYNKAWIDYQLDNGPKVYLEAKGPEFIVTIPKPAPKEE